MNIKKRASIILILSIMISCCIPTVKLATTDSTNEEDTKNQEVFYEDFSGDTLDTNKWLIAEKAWGGNNGGVVAKNVSVSDGLLKLEGHGDKYEGDVKGINKSDGKRTGAAIATKEYFGSGSYEVVAKVCPKLGACSAIWTFEYEEYYPGDEKYEELAKGGSYYAVNHEIDIEMPGRPAKETENISYDYALCNTWIGEKGDEYTTSYTKLPSAQNDGKFHTYRFDWHTGDKNEEPRVEFYIDGELVKVNKTHIPTNKGRLWLGIWFPNGWAGTPDFDTEVFEIDSVKITPFNEVGDTEPNETYANDGWHDTELDKTDNKPTNENIKIDELDEKMQSKLRATQLGIGGGGALFFPAISPHNSNEMLVVPDMGGIYISHNKGESWNRKNLYGIVYAATYDPNIPGVIYAGGSGLYRSTDNGENFELIFPKKDDIITSLTNGEGSIYYYFTHSKTYDPYKYVKSILIDPENSNHIFVLCYRNDNKEGSVYESTDNGENFHQLFTYNTTNSSQIYNGVNKLGYRRETRDLFVINDEGIIGYNLDKKVKTSVYKSDLGLVDVETVYENNQTYFIVIEKTNQLNNSYTKVYYTTDFVNVTDITSTLTSVKPTQFYDEYDNCGTVTYKYNFRYVVATSLNNIYVTNSSQPETSERGQYWTITGIIRYHNKIAEYLYGNPFKAAYYLKSRLWDDNNTEAYGIALSKQNEEEFLFTTILGVNYAEDNTHIYPRYSTCTEGTFPDCKYTTNGIDEQTTYGVREDPFHENVMFLLNTDLGLIKSDNGGKSWYRTNNGILGKWCNTVYDLAFDKERENYVYSIWSSRHDAPYFPGNETDEIYGGFAISKDCGETWDCTYSSGIPQDAIPVKMSIVYPKNSKDVTIYVATYNKGFFVSYDSGKTFSEINDGIEKVSYQDGENYQYILASDIEVKEGRIFGITARSYYNNKIQPGELYEFIDGKWNKIQLPENVKTPRDIYYHNGILYISSTATAVWDSKNGADFNNYGAGVYTYKDGKFTQIFDESISTTSVQIDSKGTMYISDIEGNIYRKEKNKDYQKIYDSYHYRSKGIELSSNDDYLYLASFGGGLLKLENLNSLYEHKCLGGTATCTKKAICDICKKEYGELDKNNHSVTTTHKENEKNATCKEAGYTGDLIYDCCNTVKEKGKVIEKLAHQYNDGKITEQATYEHEGEKTYTCTICGDTKIEKIPKLEKDENENKVENEDLNKKEENNQNNNEEQDSEKVDTQDKKPDLEKDNTQNKKQEQDFIDNTIASGKLPQTGRQLRIGLWCTILALVMVAIYSKIKSSER